LTPKALSLFEFLAALKVSALFIALTVIFWRRLNHHYVTYIDIINMK
jgi:hypothetical protein